MKSSSFARCCTTKNWITSFRIYKNDHHPHKTTHHHHTEKSMTAIMYLLVVTFTFLSLQFVTPFASSASVVTTTTHPAVSSSSQKLTSNDKTQRRRTARYYAALPATRSSSTEELSSSSPRSSSCWKQFISKLKRRRNNETTTHNNNTSEGEIGASLLSRLTFQYTYALLKEAAQKRRLEVEDALDTPTDRNMETTVPELTRIYQELQTKAKQEGKQQNNNVSESFLLTKALFIQQRKILLLTAVLRLVNTTIQAFPAVLVSRLLKLIEAGEVYPASHAFGAALALVSVLSLKMITENQYFHHVVKGSTQVRGSLAGLIFDKSLRLPGGGSGVKQVDGKGEDDSLGIGGVLNLMQSDTGIVENAALQVHTTWDGPLQLAIYTSLLYHYLGSSVFWGIGVLLMTIPINSVTLRILNRLSRAENEAKDARTKRTSESISNMKLLKLQSWEGKFADNINEYRDMELSRHRMRGVVRALNNAVSNAVPALVLVVTLTAYARSGKPIVASTIFTAISLFNQLRFPLFFFPMLIDSLANGKNAMRRISSYLSSEEMTNYVERLPPSPSGGYIRMENGNFLWPASRQASGNMTSGTAALCDVSVEVKPGEIVAVVGSVGSGKTALLKGLLGELDPVPKALVRANISHRNSTDVASEDSFITSKVITHGPVAYCSQEAWLPKGTLKDAIVFGREFNQTRYRRAIYDSGLDEDVVENEMMISTKEGLLSDSTDVGEGGSSLSGGQRARVALARALYAGDDTKIFLLDDVMAALDANVGSTVFERLRARLKRSKAAAVIVTNDPSLPRRCDSVILMGKSSSGSSCSSVVDKGPYDLLLSRGHRLESVAASSRDEDLGSEEEYSTNVDEGTQNTHHSAAAPSRVTGLQSSLNGTDIPYFSTDTENLAAIELNVEFNECGHGKDRDCHNVTETQAMGKEALSTPDASYNVAKFDEPKHQGAVKLSSADDVMSEGAIPLSTYTLYMKSIRKPVLIAAMLLSYLAVNGSQFYQQFTIAKWTELSHGGMMAESLSTAYLRRLVNAAGVVSVFLWLRSFLTMQVGLRASEYFHSRMLRSVFAAPMSFFDTTPSGQLLSRFGKEIETIDRGVPDSIGSVLFCFLQIFTSVAALAGAVTPVMIIPLSLVGILYFKAMSLFRPAARDMKRAETRTRSPIFTQFGEALRGVDTIRSVPGAASNWSNQHRSLFNKNLGVVYTVKAFDRWLSTRLETLGNTVVFTAAVVSVMLTRSGSLKAGSVGFGLTQALAITGLLTWAVRCFTDLETNMLSVVRVKELTDTSEDSLDGSTAHIIPTELGKPGSALELLVQEKPPGANITMSSINSDALIESGWPWKGVVKFSNVSMRYTPDGPLILRGVDVSVPAGSTLGIVGRTGSGKSSLLLTLFRLVEIEGTGSITIDGIDIRSVGLSSLRESLAIIPQDPVLFAGTLASNLDATNRARPEDMWASLDAAAPSLAKYFREGNGLDSYISEGGKNLSLGQRQLICLARALLRKTRVLVLDEATSSVDSRTDEEVQDTIRREFVNKGVTVITVAHRLDTVLGYDNILVLGSGEVVEYGSPRQLLRDPYGEFRQLVEADRMSRKKGSKTSSSQVMSGA